MQFVSNNYRAAVENLAKVQRVRVVIGYDLVSLEIGSNLMCSVFYSRGILVGSYKEGEFGVPIQE